MTHYIWIPVLLSCMFTASDNSHVLRDMASFTRYSGKLDIEPITLPEGIDPKNINVHSYNIRTCVGMEEELAAINARLQEKTAHTHRLNEVAFGLRRDVTLLKMQLDTCSSTASAVAGSYQTQLNNKMKQLLQTFDSDAFLILQIISLTSEVTVLQRKVKVAANSTQSQITLLRNELLEKIIELNNKKQEIEGRHPDAALIVEIISLQNKIWDWQQEQSTGGTTGTQQHKRITDLQNELDRKIEELPRGGGSSAAALLELISVHSNTATIDKLISVQIQKSRSNHVDYQKQLRQKTDLLKRMILRLNKEENNTVITKEILTQQIEVEQLRQLMSNARKITDSQVRELRVVLEEKKKKQDILQKQLEETEYVQSQMIIKIINVMKELRELRENEPLQTMSKHKTGAPPTPSQDKAQQDTTVEEVKTEFNQKIAELNRTGDATAALILNMINLHSELRTLRVLIATTNDPQRRGELLRQLEDKQDEINSGTANIHRRVTDPKTLLTIIKLQNEILDLQQNASNETISNQVKELQVRLDGVISKLDGKDNENTKLMLKVVTLQSQVEQLQKQLSEAQVLRITQVNELRDDLATKKKELQKYVEKLHEKNQTNARLILTVTDLHNQLRKHEAEQVDKKEAFVLRINELREQLKEKAAEHQRDQDKIKTLESKLNQTEVQCSNFEQKIKDVQKDLDDKMKELQSQDDSVTSLALQISTLSLQQEEVKRQLENTESAANIKELQKLMEEKKKELDKKIEELKSRSAQPQRLLDIILIQTEIERFGKNAVNDTHYFRIKALQYQLNQLVEGIQDENTKLVFQILIAQEEIARLKRQEESQSKALLQKIKDLENELEDVRNKIREKTLDLDSSDFRIANLTAHIMDLLQKIKPLEDEISYLKDTNTQALAELHEKLNLTTRQLQDSELRLKQADKKTFNLIMEMADLQAKLKKTQAEASRAARKTISDVEQQAEIRQKERRKLENVNRELEREVNELKKCCNDNNAHCEDVEADLQKAVQLIEALEQRLNKKSVMVEELRKDLEEESKYYNKLRRNNTDLQTEKTRLEALVQDLQNRLNDVDDKTIHTRSVTLDPNTAHPRVSLSADNTQMVTHEHMQNVPDHPSRFDVALAVLGKTGHSSGRHYWEVSVAGSLCYHIGMASESAPRKGTFSFSPTTGFWTVVLNKQGQFRAIDRLPLTIPFQTQPLTLGILLDYSKGQVSFYDAGARTHIYSFQSQKFRDKIYPFINFCVEDAENHTPIVVLTPGSVDWIK